MAMTRKDYIKFAEALGTIKGIELTHSNSEDAYAITNTLTSVTSYIGSIFEADNPNFDWDRFESAIEKEFEETLERMP